MIKDFLKRFLKNDLARGSLILIVAVGFLNLFNVIFHFVSTRLLGPADYSVVATIINIAYIFTIPTEAIQTILCKYTSKFKNNKKKLNNLLVKSVKKFFFISLICFILFALISPLTGSVLKIDSKLLIFSGIMIFGIFLLPIGRGVLQGKKDFKKLGLSFFLEGFVKVFGALVLILIGLRVYGAVGGILLSLITGFLIVGYFIKDIFKIKSKRNKIKGIYSYSYPTLISIGTIILFYSIDVILAKIFFSPDIAGKYALLSMFGKVIFFATSPISKAMFPLISEKKTIREKRDITKKAFLFVFLIAIAGIIIYLLFPQALVQIFGKDFLGFERYIVLPAIALSFLSLTNIFVFYNLATDKLKLNLCLIFFIILQVVLMSIFSQNIMSFLIAFIVSNAITFIFYLFSYFKKTKK